MGSYFSKDYYINEEESEHSDEVNTTPTFRILKDDPRSASLGIVRTPIQVEATPKRPPVLIFSSSKITSTTSSDKDREKEDLLVTDHQNIERELAAENTESSEINNKLDEGEEEEKIETDVGENIIKSRPLVRRYLETNLDDFVTSPLCDSVLLNENAKEEDNQSTTEVNGAELSSVSPCTVHTATLLDVSDFMDDPSAVVTDIDDSFAGGNSENMNISINTWLEQMENEMSHCSLYSDLSPQKSVDDLVLANKKLFLTPDAKIASSSPAKVRTPLQEVKKNLLVELPSSIIKRKQWRCIQEERIKRGLSQDNENTPPPMPPFSNLPASAPGKMVHKKRIASWDQDSTVFI